MHFGPFPCPSFPWCFRFLGAFLAVKFLGLFECFLLFVSRVFKGSQGETNPWYFRKDQGKEGQGMAEISLRLPNTLSLTKLGVRSSVFLGDSPVFRAF